MLTGMGDDGALCMGEMRRGGALTIAQDAVLACAPGNGRHRHQVGLPVDPAAVPAGDRTGSGTGDVAGQQDPVGSHGATGGDLLEPRLRRQQAVEPERAQVFSHLHGWLARF